MYEPITVDLKTLQQRYEHNCMYLLLNALNSIYKQVHSQILYSTELPTISNVVSLLQREETRKTVMNLSIPVTDISVEKSVLIEEKKIKVGDTIPEIMVEAEAEAEVTDQQHIAITVPKKVTVEIGVGCSTLI
jgi:hypothetical protein